MQKMFMIRSLGICDKGQLFVCKVRLCLNISWTALAGCIKQMIFNMIKKYTQ